MLHRRAVTPRAGECWDCPRSGVIIEGSPGIIYHHYRIVPPDEPIFVGKFWGRRSSRECALDGRRMNAVDTDVRPCAVCTRLICGGDAVTICSDACVQIRWRAQRRLARRSVCRGCGQGFVGCRADSRYCSPACRQKAYRARHLASRAMTADGRRGPNRPSTPHRPMSAVSVAQGRSLAIGARPSRRGGRPMS